MTIRRIAVITAVVLGTVAFVLLLYEFRQAIILFAFSLAVAAAVRPYVEYLKNRGVSSTLALILFYFVSLVLFLILLIAVGSQLIKEIQTLGDSLAKAYDQIWVEWPKGTDFQQLIVKQLPPPASLYESFSPSQQGSSLQGLFGFTMLSFNFLGQVVTVLILSIYWSLDRVHFERLWLSLLRVESRAQARNIWRYVEHDFGAYIRSEIMQSLFAGFLLGVGLWAMGVPYPTTLALFAAVAWLIPWFGGVLAVLPVAISGLSQSLGLGIFAGAYTIGVLFFLELYIEPHFIRRRQFSSLLTILLIIAFIEPFGLLGFIVAPPLAATIQLVIRYNLQMRAIPESTQETEQFSVLRGRIYEIRRMASRNPENLAPQTLNLLDRLEELVHRSEQTLNTQRQTLNDQQGPLNERQRAHIRRG